MVPFSRLLLTTLFFLLITTITITTSQTITVTPNKITDPNIPLTIQWNNIPSPQHGDALVIYVIPTSYSQGFPIDDEYQYKHLIGFYKIFDLDPQFTGRGVVNVPVFAPRDYGFYFEYINIDAPTMGTNDKDNSNNDNLSTKKVIAYTSLIPDAQINTCSQFHIAFTHNSTQLRLSYTTLDTTNQHFVHISTNKALIDQFQWTSGIANTTISGFFPSITTGTYTIDQMVEQPANVTKNFIKPGYFREADLYLPTDVISPSKTAIYYYRVRNASGLALSKVFPLYNQNIDKTKVDTDLFLFGDSGVGFPFYTETDQQQTAVLTYNSIEKLINERRVQGDMTPTSILHIGDLTYSRGYGYLNEYFFQQIESLAASYPYMVSIGNHEYCYRGQPWKPDWHNCGDDSGGEAGVTTFRRWAMPRDFQYTPYTENSIDKADKSIQEYTANSMRNIAYSYDTGHIHITVFNVELDFTEGSAQYNFIINDLKNVDRKKTPWVILSAHRPPYCTTEGCAIAPNIPVDQSKSIDLILRRLIQPLMVKYNVNIGLWGHVHVYERFTLMGLDDYKPITTYAVKNDRYNPQTNHFETIVENIPTTRVVDGIEHIKSVAPLHILSGAAGNEYNPPLSKYMKGLHGGFSAYHHQTPEFVTFRTMNFGFSHFRANATHLVGKWYSNQATTLHDHFVLEMP